MSEKIGVLTMGTLRGIAWNIAARASRMDLLEELTQAAALGAWQALPLYNGVDDLGKWQAYRAGFAAWDELRLITHGRSNERFDGWYEKHYDDPNQNQSISAMVTDKGFQEVEADAMLAFTIREVARLPVTPYVQQIFLAVLNGESQVAVATRLGVTQGRVSQIMSQVRMNLARRWRGQQFPA